MKLRFAIPVMSLAIALLSGCISRNDQVPKDQVLLAANNMTKSELLQSLKDRSLKVTTLFVTKSSMKASRMRSNDEITNYHDVNAKIAVDRPARIRLQIEKLITLAEMVSDDKTYKVSIPKEGKFGVGSVTAPVQGAEFPYNLRPSHILDALFVDGEQFMGKPGIDAIIREDALSFPDGLHSYYVVLFAKTGGVPLEELWFDRTVGVMEVVRKKSYLADGKIEADIRYSDYAVFNSIPFPKSIVISRPIENYKLDMTFERLELNTAVEPSMFVLNRPDGVVDVDLNTGKDIKPK